GIVAILAGAPEGAADFARPAAGMVGVAESEVVGAADIGCLVGGAIAGSVPIRIPGEVLRTAVVPEVVEVDRHPAAGLHHIHQAEVVERGALPLVTFGEIDGERGRAGEAAAGLLLVALGQPRLLELSRLMRIAVERE